MRVLIYNVVFLLLGSQVYAQTVSKGIVGPLAASDRSSGHSFTVGEVIVGGFSNEGLYVGHGFQHGTELEILSSNVLLNEDYEIRVFPNPVSSARLNVDLKGRSSKNQSALDYTVLNALGQTILQGNLEEDVNNLILMSQCPTGTYVLRIRSAQGTLSIHKLQIIN